MKPKISVVVPVYNTKDQLKTCLNALLRQSFKELEIIVVDDGSPDDAKELILEYHNQYKDIIIPIIKENEGPGIARNTGIQHARGEYLGFVDSDDWADPEMYKKLYKAASKGHDFILCDYVEIQKEGQRFLLRGFTGTSFNHRQAVLHSTDAAFSCNKLIKKSLFRHLMYPDGWYEDLATIPILLSYAESPAYVDKPLYYYKVRSGSITNSNHVNTLGVVRAWERLLALANPHFRQEIEYAVATNIIAFLKFKPEYVSDFMAFAQEHRNVFESNVYYREAVNQGRIHNLYTM